MSKVYMLNRGRWPLAVPEMHRNIFRGKFLGTSFTATQRAAIAAGTWDDLYVGDYWTINGHTWRIADFDYWLGRGDVNCTTHHIVVLPDMCLFQVRMQDTADTSGGYYNSEMRSLRMAAAKDMVTKAFGDDVILSHRISLVAQTRDDGSPSGVTWADSEVDLMTERMVYGASAFSPPGMGNAIYTTEFTQLALFAFAPQYICIRAAYWLRDTRSATHYCNVDGYGQTDCRVANASNVGVRPAVGIIGA